jgi:sigma-B regulation protein RsbU (phosphoserine phosphatase)
VGVLWMDKPGSDTLVTSDQMTTLTTLAYQAGIIIDNFSMYHALENANLNLKEINDRLAVVNDDLTQAQAKINKDLAHAQTIQSGLLPSEFSDIGDLKVGARYIPASQVGGDYYDFFQLDDNRFGLVIADVSGHGVAAAMIMAMTKVLLKTFSHQLDSPQKTLERINSIFQNDIKSDNFVTIFFAMLNVQEKKLRFVSAGHNPILFLNRNTGSCELIKADGLFLGVFEDMMLNETERPYKPGDRIVLYTDGLTEAENNKGEMYGLERLIEFSKVHGSREPDAFLDALLQDLNTFTQSRSLEDDVTLLIIDF